MLVIQSDNMQGKCHKFVIQSDNMRGTRRSRRIWECPACHPERWKAKQESLAKGLGVKHVSFRATTCEARVGREESATDFFTLILFFYN